MSRTQMGLVGIASGVLLFVAGVFAWFGENSILLLVGLGFLILFAGLATLLSTQSLSDLTLPHPYIYVPLVLALLLHGFQHVKIWPAFSFGWFAWALMPYGLVLALSCFGGTRTASVAAAVVALLLDGFLHYDLSANRQSSTAGLAHVWIPIWSTLIVVPVATVITRLIILRRATVSPHAP